MFIKKKETKTADDNDYDAIQNRDRHRRNKKKQQKTTTQSKQRCYDS